MRIYYVILFVFLSAFNAISMYSEFWNQQPRESSFFNFGRPSSDASPYSLFGSFNGDSEPQHNKNIEVPQVFSSRFIKHVYCDCNEFVGRGHWCGSHALRHALDIHDRMRDYKRENSAEHIMKVIAELGIPNTKEALTNSNNLLRTAHKLGFKGLFLAYDVNGYIYNLGMGPNAHEERVRVTKEFILQMKNEFFTKSKKQPHFYFVTFQSNGDGHVVLIAVIPDGDNFRMEIVDNLNEPLKVNTPIYNYAEIIYNVYFVKPDLFSDLFDLLSPTHGKKYNSCGNKAEIINQLLTECLRQQQAFHKLNSINKKLKEIYDKYPKMQNKISREIIRVYDAMVKSLNDDTSLAKEKKFEVVENLIKAIKNCNDKYFSLTRDIDASELFETAQGLRSRLQN